MFFCDACRKKKEWPESFSKSNGRCEVCGKTAVCNDIPSSALPWPKTMPPEEIARVEAELDAASRDSIAKSRFYVTEGGIEREVTVEEFVAAERSAGFFNTTGHPERPATAGFSQTKGGLSISGRVEYAH